jgi:hypothetical protein
VVRATRRDEREIEVALRAAAAATTAAELRLYQSILIPALTGVSLDATAALLGLSRRRVCLLRRQFRAGVDVAVPVERRGGRRRSLMSFDDELRFLSPWLGGIRGGSPLVVSEIRSAYQAAVGRSVPKSTVYRLLARHGWRRA